MTYVQEVDSDHTNIFLVILTKTTKKFKVCDQNSSAGSSEAATNTPFHLAVWKKKLLQ
jgi:hypothetical protein